METVTLIGKGRQNVTCCMYVKLMVKYFLIGSVLVLGVVLDLDNNVFP